MKTPIIIVLHQLGFGGVTAAVLDQSRMFTEAGHRTTIVTFNDDPGLERHVASLRRAGRLPAQVEVLNPHEDRRRGTQMLRPVSDALCVARRAWQGRPWRGSILSSSEVGRDAQGEYIRRFDRRGRLRSQERLDDQSVTRQLDRVTRRHQIRRDIYGGGYVYKRVWLDAATEDVVEEQYLNPEGFCYLSRWVDPATGKGRGVFEFSRWSRSVEKFSGLPEWHVTWLQRHIDSMPGRPIVIGETPSTVTKVQRLDAASAVRLGMLHNNQYAEPFVPGSPIREDHRELFDGLTRLDALVVLSERQRGDVIDLFGQAERIHVVHNAIQIPERVDRPRDERLVSIVSRLAPQKAIHEAIEAFVQVLDVVPDARLEIYGRGRQHRMLADLIEARGIGGNVALMGRTETPGEVMARSSCTLSTSNWEALPLSILDSAAYGTPVVAYDCLYGPSTIIDDGVTGHLVPQGDREALARAVIGILTDPVAARRMGEAARVSVAERFGYDRVLGSWERVFEAASSGEATVDAPTTR